MKNRIQQAVLVSIAAIAASGASSALADVITLNQTVSGVASFAEFGQQSISSAFSSFDQSVLIHQGDIIDLTVNFAPGASAHLTSTGGVQVFSKNIWQDGLRSPAGTSNFTITNTSFNLLGAQGSFPAQLNLPNLTGGSGGILTWAAGNYLPAGQDVTFTGMHARFTVGALQNGQSYYLGTTVYARGDQLSFTAPAVPEPTTWGMLLGGLGALALLRRRRLMQL
ncbi:MAG: hypothetical protein RL748_1331 [Pseudomonadota bacterium]